MSITESGTIVFANCAGAARLENCNPHQLGQDLKGLLSEEELNGIVALGLSEVIISVQSLPKCSFSGSIKLPSPYEAKIHLDDLNDFQAGFNHNDPKSYYLSHVNSRDHHHPSAIEKKWRGSTASDNKLSDSKISERIANEFNRSRDVYQGTGAMLFADCMYYEGLQLRRAGVAPLLVIDDDPLEYRGNRDSEPRSAIIFQGLSVANDLNVDLVFCQLETNNQDLRAGKKEKIEKSKGVAHRIAQIDRLCKHLQLNDDRPVILMGDFNARPGSKELDHLCKEYGFFQVLPEGAPTSAETSGTWGELYAFGSPHIDRPNSEIREDEQGWPCSHLNHGILIDHAFVKGLSSDKWSCGLRVIELANESGKERVSDHRPIALTIGRRG